MNHNLSHLFNKWGRGGGYHTSGLCTLLNNVYMVREANGSGRTHMVRSLFQKGRGGA